MYVLNHEGEPHQHVFAPGFAQCKISARFRLNSLILVSYVVIIQNSESELLWGKLIVPII